MTIPGVESFDEDDVLRSCCRSSFRRFIREAWHLVPGAGTPVWNWHMWAIADEMQRRAEDVFAGRPRRHDVVINISPGTSKSTICSILFHPWTWTRMPTARHLNASHTSDLVLDLAYKSREVIRSEWYRRLFPEVVLCDDADAKGLFRNTAGGDRLACTVAGRSPMGFHAHFLTVDDPIDPKKVLSVAELKTAREFMTSVLPTRKVDKKVSVTFLIMQRLHAEDPTAVMLETARKAGATPVKHYCLPAELVKLDDGSWDAAAVKPRKLASHYVDGVMDPGRLDRTVLNTFRAQLGAYGFSGQFLQSPTPPGGGMFKCLVAGTKVLTITGHKDIERVKEGDLVLTRKGFRRVLRSKCSGHVDELITLRYDGGSLTSTPDHRIWCPIRGFVEARSLRIGDLLLGERSWNLCVRGWIENLRKEDCAGVDAGNSLTSRGITGRQVSRDIFMDTTREVLTRRSLSLTECCIIGRRMVIGGARAARNLCTDLCGNITTDPFQMAERFIIGMGTPTTTRSIIWNASRIENISGSIGRGLGLRGNLRYCRKPLNGFRSIPRRDGRSKNISDTSAFGAMRNLGPGHDAPSITAVESAKLAVAIPVYDLEVEGAHEFFANGVLVHNSHYFNQRVKAAPYHAKRIRYWDRAASQDSGCRTAGVLLALANDGNLYIEHVVAGQWEPTERNEIMRATAMRDKLRYGPKNAPIIWVEAEGGSSGRDAWKGVAMALAGFPVREDRVTGNKVSRAEPWSAQLAARNVYVVDNAGSPDWDVQGYVDEHVAFPLGKLKDVVDASSGAFNLLVGRKASPQLRVLSVGVKKGLTRIVACSKEELGVVIVDEPALMIVVEDPLPPGEVASPEGSLPPHSCLKLVEGVRLTFADVAPSEVQDAWDVPLESCGRKPEEVIMRPEDGKRMWAAISKKRSGPAPILMFVDDGGDDRRALSLAMGVSDVIGQPRSAIHRPSRPDEAVSGDPPNAHVHAVVKASRSSVM